MSATAREAAARRYRIEKYLTEGGMGAIYIGKKLGPGGFEKEVVLKQLLPEYTSRPEFRDLFFREAKISATLDHANIVHTFDLVESDQSLFIVMEYVRGADLRTIVRRARQRRRQLSPAAAIHVALEILAGLSYAHTRKDATGKTLDIIHRDVSPSNIICSAQGEAKLSDFGIAKASTYSSVFYRVRGKVGYMSPEQARSESIDHRCDLYSLSVCLYESLTGERLFVGDLNTPADEIYGHPILPVSRKRPGLPPALDVVLARALATHVDDRYQTALELAGALGTVAHRNGLAFSAPELAAHLHDILGDDPERWLRDEPAVASSDAPTSHVGGGEDLVGKEASSIGIVNDVPGDEPARPVLSPSAVSGSKDFDLDSMLNGEATRPGSDGLLATPASNVVTPADGRVSAAETPPPVWTRNSGPVAAAPSPARPTLPPAAPPAPAAPPPPAAPLASTGARPRRATQRTAAVPPPFAPTSRAVPPPPPPPGGVSVRSLPVPFPRDAAGDAATPPPLPRFTTRAPVAPAAIALPTATAPIVAAPPATAAPVPQHTAPSFEIEDILTPQPAAASGPANGPAPIFRPLPPAPYPSATPEPPLVLSQPQTVDFSGSLAGLLPEKKGGPPAWLALVLIAGSALGGAALASRATQSAMGAIEVAPPPSAAAALRKTGDETGASAGPAGAPTTPSPAPAANAEAAPAAEPTAPTPPSTVAKDDAAPAETPSVPAAEAASPPAHGKHARGLGKKHHGTTKKKRHANHGGL